jgi:hypothetical protein
VFSVSSAEEFGVHPKERGKSLRDFEQDVDLVNKIQRSMVRWQKPKHFECEQFRDISRYSREKTEILLLRGGPELMSTFKTI